MSKQHKFMIPLERKLSDLTLKIYSVNVRHQIISQEDDYWVIFESSPEFNWYDDGVFIYQPDHEGDPGVKYIKVGSSALYELDANQPLSIWIRKDFDQLIKQYFPHYCVSDIEHPHSPNLTDFVIASCESF